MASLPNIHSLTKGSVRRAGDKLRDISANKRRYVDDDLIDAIYIAEYWRQLHMYPLNTFQPLLRQKIGKAGVKGTQVAQRLKKMSTLVGKLSRITGSLHLMQDIAGMRVVFKNPSDLRKFENELRNSRFRHVLKRRKDYIIDPKIDGYRGIHLIYGYNPITKDVPATVQGLMIELQLRTQLQHYWATAVEAVDMFYGQSLKFGKGAIEWNKFFSITSAVFAHKEKLPLPSAYKNLAHEELISKLSSIEAQINAVQKLNALSSLTGQLSAKERKSNKTKFYLLILKHDVKSGKRSFQYMSFAENEELSANIWYASYEKDKEKNVEYDVVLVRTSGRQLALLYSNYFLDVSNFLKAYKESTEL